MLKDKDLVVHAGDETRGLEKMVSEMGQKFLDDRIAAGMDMYSACEEFQRTVHIAMKCVQIECRKFCTLYVSF